MALTPGVPAPDAALAIRPREFIRLREQFGTRPVVLLFFPFAYSSVCTEEMCAVAEDWSAYEALDAAVFGISIDSPYVNVKFAADCNAPFPILSDFNKEAAQAYGVLREELGGLRGVAERAAFVIAPDGTVAYAWVGEHPGLMPDFEAIKGALEGAVSR